jgi:hypothetical protein
MITPSSDDLDSAVGDRKAEVVAVPDKTNAELWKAGLFKVRDVNTPEEHT